MKMERGRRVRALVIFGLVIRLLLVGQFTAANSFEDCYVARFLRCVLRPSFRVFYCAIESLRECIPEPSNSASPEVSINSFNPTNLDHTQYFCKLGCASSLCTNLSTKENPAGEKVESCVDSCSGACTKNYISP